MRSAFPVLFCCALIGCASSSPAPAPGANAAPAAAAHGDPEIEVVQLSSVADAARNNSGTLPVQFRVTIHNTTKIPLQLKRIDLQSLGYGAYSLAPFSRAFNDVIDVGESKATDLWTTGAVNSTISGANGPVTIRAIVQFESSEGRFQTVLVQQVEGARSY